MSLFCCCSLRCPLDTVGVAVTAVDNMTLVPPWKLSTLMLLRRCSVTFFDGQVEGVKALEVHRGFITDGRVSAMRVVPTLDVVEDLAASHGVGVEATSVDELTIEGGEEALTERVVVEQSPTEPIEGRTEASRQRRPKAMDVYWHP